MRVQRKPVSEQQARVQRKPVSEQQVRVQRKPVSEQQARVQRKPEWVPLEPGQHHRQLKRIILSPQNPLQLLHLAQFLKRNLKHRA